MFLVLFPKIVLIIAAVLLFFLEQLLQCLIPARLCSNAGYFNLPAEVRGKRSRDIPVFDPLNVGIGFQIEGGFQFQGDGMVPQGTDPKQAVFPRLQGDCNIDPQ